jgi:hypothetical protein
VAGGIVIVIVLLLVFPPLLFGAGLALTMLLGWALKSESDATHEGSELIELNR